MKLPMNYIDEKPRAHWSTPQLIFYCMENIPELMNSDIMWI